MRYRIATLLFTLIVLPACTNAAFAQRDTDPESLMRRWMASQDEAIRGVEHIIFEERTEHALNGPFGTRTLRIHARLLNHPRSNSWRRDILAAFVHDRKLTQDEYEHLARSSGLVESRAAERLLEALLLPPRLLTRMRPVRRAARDQVGSKTAWRFDLAPPPNARTSIRRVTVWMDADQANLLQMRAVLQRPGRGSTTLVTTTYGNVSGLDVPLRRTIEGTITTRRRLRTFTHLLRVESEYLDYRIDRP